MYKLNESKVYLDKADGNVIAILTETFVYYTFNELAGAVMEDIVAGAEIEAIKDILYTAFDKSTVDAEMEKMLSELISAEMISENEEAVSYMGELQVSKVAKVGTCKLLIDHYDDVAEYFAADPIHEVNPEMGWPHQK